MQVICLIMFYSFDNLPNANSGGLFSKANLQTLSFSRVDDGFDSCVYESAAGKFYGYFLADFEVAYAASIPQKAWWS